MTTQHEVRSQVVVRSFDRSAAGRIEKLVRFVLSSMSYNWLGLEVALMGSRIHLVSATDHHVGQRIDILSPGEVGEKEIQFD